MNKIILSAIIFCVIAGYAIASHCGGYTVQRSYYAPQQSYYVPQQSYYYQQQYVAPTIIFGIPVQNLGLKYYYSVSDNLDEERIAARVAEIIAKRQAEQVNAPVVVQGDLDSRVLTTFQQNCASCHKLGKDTPGIQLFNADGGLFKDTDPAAEFERRWHIYDAVMHAEGVSPMPKGARDLSEAQKKDILEWVRAVKITRK
jgi:mono/diheme cytochrome c family protein